MDNPIVKPSFDRHKEKETKVKSRKPKIRKLKTQIQLETNPPMPIIKEELKEELNESFDAAPATE